MHSSYKVVLQQPSDTAYMLRRRQDESLLSEVLGTINCCCTGRPVDGSQLVTQQGNIEAVNPYVVLLQVSSVLDTYTSCTEAIHYCYKQDCEEAREVGYQQQQYQHPHCSTAIYSIHDNRPFNNKVQSI